jgi:hypothetical protein
MLEQAVKDNEAFEIRDDASAEWAIGKIKEAQAECDKFVKFYAAQTEKIKADTAGQAEYFTSLLARYFQTVPHKTTKTGIEKYKLPSGELIMNPTKIDYERKDDALLAWLTVNKPEYIKTKPEPMWDKIKKDIIAGGELPDGVTPIEKQAEFKLKIGAEE